MSLQGPGGELREIGNRAQDPTIEPHQAAVEHGDDEQRTVGRPAEARGPLRDLGHGLRVAVEADR